MFWPNVVPSRILKSDRPTDRPTDSFEAKTRQGERRQLEKALKIDSSRNFQPLSSSPGFPTRSFICMRSELLLPACSLPLFFPSFSPIISVPWTRRRHVFYFSVWIIRDANRNKLFLFSLRAWRKERKRERERERDLS